MTEPDIVELLGPALAGALEKRGFTSLTPVQQTVLDPEHEGRDLRITSQTGSGKTVAIGFALRELVSREASRMGGVAHPYALVVAPTRELAKQVEEELSWLYEGVGTRVVSVTGGTSARDERRALASGPQIVVGTPGRMLDHLTRGAIDASEVGAVVLDEADRLLDLGFRDELDAILAHTPEERRTHLVSATFPREVRALADAVQSDPAHVEGTRLGQANTDIDHVLHLVDARDRLSAMVNLLLANPDEQILVFARTRADVGEIAEALSSAGFAASSLSGEMEQNQRDRAMQAFKRGDLRVLVATDVAARGIDVQDIARVLHADPPGDADTYTHRSGRTGRAGRKGVSSTLVPPSIMAKVVRLLHRAGVKYRFEKIPSANEIRKAQDDALIRELTRDDRAATGGAAGADAGSEGAEGDEHEGAADEAPGSGEGAREEVPAGPPIDPHALALAERLASSGNITHVLARLLMRARQATGPEPRWIRPIEPPSEVARPSRRSPGGAFGQTGGAFGAGRDARPAAPRGRRSAEERSAQDFEGGEGAREDASAEGLAEAPRGGHDSQRPPASQRGPRDLSRQWSLFQVTWGEAHGADSRRMLAMLCRRGGIESRDVGAIRVGRVASTVEIAADAADQFAQAAGQVDMRDPRIVIRPASFGAPPSPDRRGSEPPPFEARRGSEPPPFEGRRGSAPPGRFEGRHGSAPPGRFERSGPAQARFERPARAERPARPARPAHASAEPAPRTAPPEDDVRELIRREEEAPPPPPKRRVVRTDDDAGPPGNVPHVKAPRAHRAHDATAPRAHDDAAPRAPRAHDDAAPRAAGPRTKPRSTAKDFPKKGWVKKPAAAPARAHAAGGAAPPKRRRIVTK